MAIDVIVYFLNTAFRITNRASFGYQWANPTSTAAKYLAHDLPADARDGQSKPPIVKWWLSPIPTTHRHRARQRLTIHQAVATKRCWLVIDEGLSNLYQRRLWVDPRVRDNVIVPACSFSKAYGLAALAHWRRSKQRKRCQLIFLNYTRQSF